MRLKMSLILFPLFLGLMFFSCEKRPQENLEKTELSESASKTQETLTLAQMKSVQRAVVAYTTMQGQVPSDLNKIRATHPQLPELTDTWGTIFKYEKLSDTEFRLTSAGKDRKFDTGDDIVLEY